MGGISHPQHTQTSINSSTIAADSSNGVTNTDAADTVVCAPDDGWKYHPKHVEQFSDINKLCNVASCWIYIGILLGAQYILHISRIRVNPLKPELNPICYLLALLGAHHFLHVSRIRVKSLTIRLLMCVYIYIYIYIWSTHS